MRAIEKAGMVFGIAGCADHRAMQEAIRRGNIADYPLRMLLTRWWTYTAITRTPELRSEVPWARERARHAVHCYRAARASAARRAA